MECALTIFYRDPKYQEWLNNMFNHMCNKTYEYLQNMEISEIDPDLRSLP